MKHRLPWVITLLALVVFATVSVAGATLAPAQASAVAQITPTPDSDDWGRVEKARKLVVGTALDNPPFSMYSDRYAPDGFDIALMKDLGARLGVKVEFKDFAFDGLLDALQLGQVDAVIAAVSITEEREALVDFTKPYYLGEDGILAAVDNNKITSIRTVSELAQHRVGVQRGSVYETYLRDTIIQTGQMKRSNLLVYTRPDGAVSDLAEDRVDLVMLDLLPAQNFVAQNHARLVGRGLFPQVYGIAVRKGSNLLGELQAALEEAQDEGATADLIEEYLDIRAELLPKPTATVLPRPTAVATPTPPPCVYGMAYVADVNYNDKNMKAPPALQKGQRFTKTWRIRNSGTCDWPANYALGYVRGNTAAARMGGVDVKVGRVVPPGGTVDISAALVAPQASGVYQGFWQMKDTAGRFFGQTLWVGVRIPFPPTPTPPPPPPGPNFTVDRSTINQGECVNFKWNVTGVRAVYFYPQGQPHQSHGVAGQATQQACPAGTTTFELRVERLDGGVELRQIVIQVNPVAGAPQIVQFNSSPEFDVVRPQCVSLWWDVQGNVSRVALVRGSTPLWDYAAVQASHTDCPPNLGPVVYELQAWGPGGFVKAQRSINVRDGAPPPPPPPPPASGKPEIIRLSASERAAVGSCIWVSWEFGANVAYARLLKNNVMFGDDAQSYNNVVPYSGNQNGDCTTPNAGTYVYRLEAFNKAGEMTVKEARTVVTAQPQPR